MASFKINSFLQVSILLLLLYVTPSLARLSTKVSTGEINTICSKTINPSFCLRFLQSTPGTSTADLRGLATIVTNSARSNARHTSDLIVSLISTEINPTLKAGYSSCSERYNGIFADLDGTQKNLNKGDKVGANVEISRALDEATDCEDELQGLSANQSVIKGSQDLENICSIILVITNLLP